MDIDHSSSVLSRCTNIRDGQAIFLAGYLGSLQDVLLVKHLALEVVLCLLGQLRGYRYRAKSDAHILDRKSVV